MVKKPEKSGAEKRIFPRRTLRTQVVFEDESGEGFIYFYSTDVSQGGIFLESDIPLKMETKVFLSFRLGSRGPVVRVTGKVVRLERTTNESLPVIGMGVQFLDLHDAAKAAIDDFLK